MITPDKVPKRYVPSNLTKKDTRIIKFELNKSRQKYKKKKYYNRIFVKSYKYKPSQHILNAKQIYHLDKIIPNKALSIKTGCSLSALKKIENKGMGAYYSSGSRPNQTAKSWGRARLASAITGGNSSIVDFDILKKGCKPNSLALKFASRTLYKTFKTRKIHKLRHVPSVSI